MVITVAIVAPRQAPLFRIMVVTRVALLVVARVVPPAIVFGVETAGPVPVAAGHRAERRIRRPVLRATGITGATVPVSMTVAGHLVAARSNVETECVRAVALHRAVLHTREPAGKAIRIGAATRCPVHVIAVTKPVTGASCARVTETSRWFIHRGVFLS